LHVLPAGELRDIKFSEHSPMPSYKQRLSREEIDNVIAYLSGLSVRPYTTMDKKQ
jgi:mono/diheme cytochrome c family protein